MFKVHMMLYAVQDRRPRLNLQGVYFLKFLCYHFIIMLIKFLINQRLQIKRSTSKKYQDGYLLHPSMTAKQISYPFIYHLNTGLLAEVSLYSNSHWLFDTTPEFGISFSMPTLYFLLRAATKFWGKRESSHHFVSDSLFHWVLLLCTMLL